MAKNLKLTIKNTQIAEAVNLSSLKDKLAGKKAAGPEENKIEPAKPETTKPKISALKPTAKSAKAEPAKTDAHESAVKEVKEEAPKIRARSRSAFAEPAPGETKPKTAAEEPTFVTPEIEAVELAQEEEQELVGQEEVFPTGRR